jgi:hypothetical protein
MGNSYFQGLAENGDICLNNAIETDELTDVGTVTLASQTFEDEPHASLWRTWYFEL